MNQREAFEQYWLKVTCGTDPAVWDSEEDEYEDEDHQLAYQHFRFGWQAAMDLGMGEPMAYGMPNTAITGSGPSMMMVRNHIPSDDQYGGALWVPLYAKPEQSNTIERGEL